MFEVWLEYLSIQNKMAVDGLQAVQKRNPRVLLCLDIRKLGLRKIADLRKVLNVKNILLFSSNVMFMVPCIADVY